MVGHNYYNSSCLTAPQSSSLLLVRDEEQLHEEVSHSTLPETTWTCTLCTFENTNTEFLSCEMCGLQRPLPADFQTAFVRQEQERQPARLTEYHGDMMMPPSQDSKSDRMFQSAPELLGSYADYDHHGSASSTTTSMAVSVHDSYQQQQQEALYKENQPQQSLSMSVSALPLDQQLNQRDHRHNHLTYSCKSSLPPPPPPRFVRHDLETRQRIQKEAARKESPTQQERINNDDEPAPPDGTSPTNGRRRRRALSATAQTKLAMSSFGSPFWRATKQNPLPHRPRTFQRCCTK